MRWLTIPLLLAGCTDYDDFPREQYQVQDRTGCWYRVTISESGKRSVWPVEGKDQRIICEPVRAQPKDSNHVR
jgi:hypothetical protein